MDTHRYIFAKSEQEAVAMFEKQKEVWGGDYPVILKVTPKYIAKKKNDLTQ